MKRSVLVLLALGFSPVALAAPVSVSAVDGVRSVGEWTALERYSTRQVKSDIYAAGGNDIQIESFSYADADYLYLAFQYTSLVAPNGDGQTPRFRDGVELRISTDGATQKRAGGDGVSGDGNDFVLDQYGYATFLPNGDTDYSNYVSLSNDSGNIYSDGSLVFVGFESGVDSNFFEVAIAKSLVDYDLYTALNIGTQAWSNGGSFNYIATAAVPLPGSALAGLLVMGGLAARRR